MIKFFKNQLGKKIELTELICQTRDPGHETETT
jgi:hypothetical protein